jgi:hypothetical protein
MMKFDEKYKVYIYIYKINGQKKKEKSLGMYIHSSR